MNKLNETTELPALDMLCERWLPVRTRNGRREWIDPSELSRPDVVAFDADRADFNGALAQMAIGLLQLVAAVQSPVQRRQRFDNPPDSATLAAWLAPHSKHFRLDGGGHRFMQDFDLRAGDAVPIGNLLIESPGENALKNNSDHFIKRGGVQRVCPHCASLALFTLQLNAPAGGAGHRTSLRGGGPLTTLLTVNPSPERSLWHTLWLNVLSAPSLQDLGGDQTLTDPRYSLPWLASVSTLQDDGGSVAPSQVHPVHALWGMPRRIRLDFESTSEGLCDICQRDSDRLLSQYVTRNYGLNYKGPWRHPLSPYYTARDDKLPLHPQPGGLGYRHWLGLVVGMANDKRQIDPAAVVTQHLKDWTLSKAVGPMGLWCFGFDMDNMKARCWYETTLPLYHLGQCQPSDHKRLRDEVLAWVQAADLAVNYLRNAVKTAWFGSDAKGDFSHVDAAFWSQTEPAFYQQLGTTITALEAGSLDDGIGTKEAWLERLRRVALRLFDADLVGAGPIEQQNMRRMVEARSKLLGQINGPGLRAALALPVEAKTRAKPKLSPEPTSAD